MSVLQNTSSDYDAFRDMVLNRPLADKVALIRELEKETFAARFLEIVKRIRSLAGKNTLSIEEISKEVDAVRSARFSGSN